VEEGRKLQMEKTEGVRKNEMKSESNVKKRERK
jgi:hypothetical protein